MINKINKFDDINLNDSADISFYENVNNDLYEEKEENEIINNINKSDIKEKDLNYQNINENENVLFKKEEKLENKLNKIFLENYFQDEYNRNPIIFHIIKNNDKKDDFNIEYKKNIINKKVESRISYQLSIKRVIEIIIVTLMLINALIKCNVLSFVYLLMIIPAFKIDLINTYLMFRISFFALILLIIQYICFISNLSYTTNPFISKEVVLNINQIFHLPWYTDYRWSTFLSLGTNRYQIISLWLDVAIILILYFYLEHFSFTVFIETKKSLDLKIISKRYYKKFSELKSISAENIKVSFVQ